MPLSVSGVNPLAAPFTAAALVATGASNVNRFMRLKALRDVPTLAVTTTPRVCEPVPPILGLQATDVAPVHAALVHMVAPKTALTVVSSTPKFMPNMVRTDPTVVALFAVRKLSEITGVSKVNDKTGTLKAVPTIERTATVKRRLPPVPAGVKHFSIVADDHEAVVHTVTPKKMVVVVSAEAKFRPETVSLP
jgi:hypothetical protein